MNLEEKLRMAKRLNYDKITVDVDKFETRLLENLLESNHPIKGRLRMKWKTVSIAALGILTPGVVFASAILNIQSHTINRLKSDIPSVSFITNGTNNQNIEKVYNLSKARAVANFPIREPASISGWNHKYSEGLLWKHVLTNKQTVIDSYFDVYTNNSGQQVTVEQTGDLTAGFNLDGSKIQFGSDNYHADMYTTSSGGEKELFIKVKEPNKTLTYIQITGKVTTDDLRTIGDAYIKAADK